MNTENHEFGMEQPPVSPGNYPEPIDYVVVLPTCVREGRIWAYVNVLLTEEPSSSFFRKLPDKEISLLVANQLLPVIAEGLEGFTLGTVFTKPSFDVHEFITREALSVSVLVYQIDIPEADVFQPLTSPFCWREVTTEFISSLSNARRTEAKIVLYLALDELQKRHYTSDHYKNLVNDFRKMLPGI